jgi:hypothetical protein
LQGLQGRSPGMIIRHKTLVLVAEIAAILDREGN